MRLESEADVELSPREREVLPLIADGWTHERIAKRLSITPATSRGIAHRIMARLGAVSMTNAVHIAHCVGLLSGGGKKRHGDHAGFAGHVRRGEDPCDECLVGERAYRQAQRKRLRQKREAREQ